MKNQKYNHILKKHGYDLAQNNDLFATYVKVRKCNTAMFLILKDNHKKGIEFKFKINKVVADNGSNMAEFERKYLMKEAKALQKLFKAADSEGLKNQVHQTIILAEE